jgi:type II secretory pathway pseudopilin PulG
MNDPTNKPVLSPAAARSGNSERGYILLVLAMFFALIAVGLMRVLPSALVETQREREEELIFRGQEYRRAIQAYVRKFGRYPNSLGDLENTNGVRFLRRRYLDPMKKKREADENLLTEKPAAWQRSDERAPEEEVEEWRLIHIGPGGTFPDAKTSITPPTQNPLAPPGGTGLPASPGMPGGPRGASSPSGGGFPTGPASQQSPFGSTPTRLGGGSAERPASPQSPFGQSSSPFGAQSPPRDSGLGIGASPGPGPGAAQLPDALRPSANPSANPAQQPRAAAAGQPGSQVFGGGGIAGVASHNTDQSIKVVNGYTQYDEWEFVYDFRADQIGMAAVARASGAVGQPVVPGQPGVQGQPGFPGIPGQPPPGVMTAQPPVPVPGGAPVPFPFPGSQAPGIRPGQPGFPGAPGSPAPGMQPSPFDPRPFPGAQPGQSPFDRRPSPGFQQPGTQQPGFGQPGFQPGFQQPGMQQPGAQPGFPPSPVPGFPPNPQQRR